MAVVTPLPNGHIVITLSPREGVLFMDEILDPAAFPWQGTESQMIAVEVKMQLKHVIQAQVMGRMEVIHESVMRHQPEEPEDEEE